MNLDGISLEPHISITTLHYNLKRLQRLSFFNWLQANL